MGPVLGHLRGPDHETEFGFGFSDLENPIGRDENVIFTEIELFSKNAGVSPAPGTFGPFGHILR